MILSSGAKYNQINFSKNHVSGNARKIGVTVIWWFTTEQAKASPRLRMNLDLRNSEADQSQRMLNAIEPGSPLPIHRHQKTSETVVCLRGRLVEEYYDELERICTERIELSSGGPIVALNIPAGQWHTVQALESGTVIMEVKDGAYEPLQDVDILTI